MTAGSYYVATGPDTYESTSATASPWDDTLQHGGPPAALLARAVEMLKAQSAQTTVLIEEGDLTRLLPKLRLGELDLFVGRLEPGYASPDLVTEALLEEPMAVVVRPVSRPSRIDWFQGMRTVISSEPPWVRA